RQSPASRRTANGRDRTAAGDGSDRWRLAEQLDFMRQQWLVVVGYMTFTTLLAIFAPSLLGGTDSMAWLLVSFACTISLPVAFAVAWRRSARFRARVLALDLAPVVL